MMRLCQIEMLEAVGSKYWNEYFNAIKKFLKPGSSALVQVITMHEDTLNLTT